jgi:acyl-CoA thioester hydrolase
MKHECRLTVRSYECDVNGHVNNATYLNYLEVARTDFLRAVGTSYRELRERGFGLVVVRVAIDFKGEALMEDSLLVVTEAVKRRFTGGTFRQTVYREGEGEPVLLADAEVVWACVNEKRRPVRVPPFLDVPELRPADSVGGCAPASDR